MCVRGIRAHTIYSCISYRIAGLIRLHSTLRTEMWTWQLADSLLRDVVKSELRPDEDDMMDDDDSQPVSSLRLSFALTVQGGVD